MTGGHGGGGRGAATSPGRSGEDAGGAGIDVAPDTLWLNECFPLDGYHMHVAVYLIRTPEGSVVIDSGSFHHRDAIRARIDEATGGRGPSAVVLSHSDYPHSGNIDAFREAWGDIEIVASSGAPDIQGLPYARKAHIGGTMEVAGRPFSFLDPPLADRSHTSWIFDRETGGLYTADGFGAYHMPGECGWTSSGYPDGVPEDPVYRFHRDALSWLRYVDPERLRSAIEEIFDEFDVRFVAPIHGPPIARPDLRRYLDRLHGAVRRISAEYTVP